MQKASAVPRAQDLRPDAARARSGHLHRRRLLHKDIAKQFTISEETVKRHLSNIFDKTGVSTRLELALFAISHKLVDIEV